MGIYPACRLHVRQLLYNMMIACVTMSSPSRRSIRSRARSGMKKFQSRTRANETNERDVSGARVDVGIRLASRRARALGGDDIDIRRRGSSD